MAEKPIWDEPCSKCGRHLMWGERPDSLGRLSDHRVCAVPPPTDNDG